MVTHVLGKNISTKDSIKCARLSKGYGATLLPYIFLACACHHTDRSPSLLRQGIVELVDKPMWMLILVEQFNRKDISGLETDKPKLPSPLKSALRDLFYKFTKEDFEACDYSRGEVTFRRLIKLCHPKPRNLKEAVLFRQIAEGQHG